MTSLSLCFPIPFGTASCRPQKGLIIRCLGVQAWIAVSHRCEKNTFSQSIIKPTVAYLQNLCEIERNCLPIIDRFSRTFPLGHVYYAAILLFFLHVGWQYDICKRELTNRTCPNTRIPLLAISTAQLLALHINGERKIFKWCVDDIYSRFLNPHVVIDLFCFNWYVLGMLCDLERKHFQCTMQLLQL